MPSWADVLGGGGKEHGIPCQWYVKEPTDINTVQLIESTALKIARENDCVQICIRSDIHNTTSALVPSSSLPPPSGKLAGGRGGNFARPGRSQYVPALGSINEKSAYTKKNAQVVSRPKLPKKYGQNEIVFVEAPWHYTVEFRKPDGSWLSAHVYTDTVEDGLDRNGIPKYKTKGLAKIDTEIKENPQMWNRDRPAHGVSNFRNKTLKWTDDYKESKPATWSRR